MLLGHWLEMRSVRQASGALDALAKLMPDTAERERPDGSTEEVPVEPAARGRPAARPAGRERACRRRGRARRVGRQRGDDHRRVPAGEEGAGREGHRRHDQRRRQPARARDRDRRADRAGRDHAAGQGSADEQVTHAGAGRQGRGLALLHRARRGRAHRHRLDDRHRLQRRGDRPRRDGAGHRLPARAGPGDPACGRHHDGQGREQRHPRARPAGAGARAADRHDHLRQDRHADRGPVRRGRAWRWRRAGPRNGRWRWPLRSKAIPSTPSRAASARRPRNRSWPCRR